MTKVYVPMYITTMIGDYCYTNKSDVEQVLEETATLLGITDGLWYDTLVLHAGHPESRER